MKKILSKILVVVAVLGFAGGAALPATVAAQVTKDEVCRGINITGGQAGSACDPGRRTEGSIARLVRTVINILSWVVGIAAIIMIIIGGFKYVLSGGDASSISSAKNTIIYALVGLVVVALAQVIVRFVVTLF